MLRWLIRDMFVGYRQTSAISEKQLLMSLTIDNKCTQHA